MGALPAAWHWLVHTDAGLLARLLAGGTVLATLAIIDYHRHGPRATRWREYAFLLAVTAVTLAYGAINDQVTSAISWEYFYYGKGLSEVLGDRIPPDALALHLQAALVGLKATWSAGLLVGVALLLANNPARRRRPLPQLPYPRLLATLPLIFTVTVITACLFAAAGYAGAFTLLSTDFHEMLRRDEFRPRRFMLVFGLHLGGYVGALLGTAAAVLRVRRDRRAAANSHLKLI
jgi:hypothetical protein